MAIKKGRRDFIKKTASIGIASIVGGSAISKLFSGAFLQASERLDISVVKSSDYFEGTVKAVNLLGGMKKFIPKNSKVAILPNAQSNHPGTYTHLDIVRATVRMCKEAGAKEINCLSWLPKKFWEGCGLDAVLAEEGAKLILVEREDAFFKSVKIPNGKSLKEAWIMKELYNNDVFIDIPITKDHAGNKFTGTMKNLMGLNSPASNRTFHKENWDTDPAALEHLDQSIADLNTVLKPALCIVDATELITTNGPFGPGRLIKPQKVVAGVDRVAIDAYCALLWDLKPENIIMIKRGFEHRLGEIDLTKVKIKETTI